MRQYLFQMGLRLVLIVAAALLAEGWVMWVCFAGAVVLPYTAVLLVNAGRDRSSRETTSVPPTQPHELTAHAEPVANPPVRVVDHTDDHEDR